MAIFAYTGLPGAGKSYETVRGPIMKSSKLGREVWTNVPVKDLPGCVVVSGPKATEHWYLDAPPGTLIVIDECWRYWGAGAAANDIPANIREWFAMHRHRTADGKSTDIVLICQDLSQIARFMRELVERTYRCRKLSALGLRSGYTVAAYDGAVTGQRPPESQLIGSWKGRYSPDVYKHYQSHTQGGVATEVAPDSRGSIWTSASVLMIPASIGIVWWALSSLTFIGTDKAALAASDKAAGANVVSPAATPPGSTPGSTPIEPPPPPYLPPDPIRVQQEPEPDMSASWTVIGVVQRLNGSGVALIRSSLGTRRLLIERDCRQQDFEEWVCKVDGKDAARWTGGAWRTFARVDPMR